MIVKFTVNNENRTLDVSPNKRLIDILRQDLNLKGTKEGCGEGECGSCTVIMDNKAVNSCLVIACQLEGKSITTIEGLGTEDNPDPLQTAFVEELAIQCGFCTTGMIMSAKALLIKNPNASEDDIKTALSGNICRCSGYEQIINAVQKAQQSGGKHL